MRSLSAIELLKIWEQGMAQAPVERALTLLAACGEGSPDALAHLSLGRRDAGLLTLREHVFGPEVACVSGCPGCGERVEVSFRASDVRVESAVQPQSKWELQTAGFAVWFRLPDSSDLAHIAGAKDVAEARQHLLARCVVSAQRGDEAIPAGEPPGGGGKGIARRKARAGATAGRACLYAV